MLLWILAGYALIGAGLAVVLRWGRSIRTDGVDLLLDYALWPLMLYFMLRYGRPDYD